MKEELTAALKGAKKLFSDDFDHKVEKAVKDNHFEVVDETNYDYATLDEHSTIASAISETFTEQRISNAPLPDCVKDLFRNRQRMGVSMRGDTQIFSYNGSEYVYRKWEKNEIINLLISTLGSLTESISEDDLNTIATMLNNGFSIVPSFYGDSEKKLKPSISWFVFNGATYNADGKADKTITITICVGKGKDGSGNITAYSDAKGWPRKIGVFSDIDDIIEVFNLKSYVPSKMESDYSYSPDYSKLEPDAYARKKEDIKTNERLMEEMRDRIINETNY